MNTIKYLVTSIILILVGCEGAENAFFLEESGTLETRNVIVSSQTGGEIITLFSDDGARVKKGDPLALVDTTKYHLQVSQAFSAMIAAEATYNLLMKGARDEDKIQAREMFFQAEEEFNLAESDKSRFEKLFEQKAVTKKQLDDITTRYNISKSRLTSARANYKKINNIARPEELRQAKANYERAVATYDLAKKSLDDCLIVSPINGIIANRFIEEHETVAPLSSIFKINEMETAELSIYVAETDLPKVKPGQKAEVTIDAWPDKKFEGKVTYISPEAEFTPKNIQTKDERTKLVFKVKITLPNPDGELKPGLPADAKVYFDGN